MNQVTVAATRTFSDYSAELNALIHARRRDLGCEIEPGLEWVTGYLGDPASRIWFVGENASLTGARRTPAARRGNATADDQWWVERFRSALVEAEFKDGPWDAPGGWHCYVTDLMKEAVLVKDWQKKKRDQLARARDWSPVLRWELANARPLLAVLMGKHAQRWFREVVARDELRGIELLDAVHYSYRFCPPTAFSEGVAAARRRFDALIAAAHE